MNNTFGIKGVEDHCHFLKSIDDAHRLRLRISRVIEHAGLPHLTPEERRRHLNFVVVGGGPTGVELVRCRRACACAHAGTAPPPTPPRPHSPPPHTQARRVAAGTTARAPLPARSAVPRQRRSRASLPGLACRGPA